VPDPFFQSAKPRPWKKVNEQDQVESSPLPGQCVLELACRPVPNEGIKFYVVALSGKRLPVDKELEGFVLAQFGLRKEVG